MQRQPRSVVVLGTGGTIAGVSQRVGDDIGYVSAQLGVERLVEAIAQRAGSPAGISLEIEQVAQLDSKDMDVDVWLALARRVALHLARADVAGVVVTHGTDTLEETAYFLHRVVPADKPVVLTGAMRPATALLADGPQNLLDAVRLAACDGVRGVMVAFAGTVFAADGLRKAHPYRLAAFSAGDAGPLARMEAGMPRPHRPWPTAVPLGLERLPADPQQWPRVEIVHSHAGASAAVVRALCADGVHGIVAACTGNGTLHHRLEAALREAMHRGVQVMRASRCLDGTIVETDVDSPGLLPSAGALTPVQARIELMLRLMPAAAGT